jgi:hypothetical protein
MDTNKQSILHGRDAPDNGWKCSARDDRNDNSGSRGPADPIQVVEPTEMAILMMSSYDQKETMTTKRHSHHGDNHDDPSACRRRR